MQAVGRIVERTPQSKAFPFEKGEEVLIVADEKKKRLIIEKLEPRTV